MLKLPTFPRHEQAPSAAHASVFSHLLALEMVKDCNGSQTGWQYFHASEFSTVPELGQVQISL